MKIERLDPRLQFAGLSGLVYNDADASRTLEAVEMPMDGVTVFIDGNVNGQFDGGEQSTTTDADGRYTFANLPKGDYTLGTTLTRDQYTSTTAMPTGTRKGRFDIQINGLEDASSTVRAAFMFAKARWEAVILGDLPDVTTPGGVFYDDVVIDATIGTIDGVGGTLGFARVTGNRPESQNYIPYEGEMRFDSDDLAAQQSNDTLNALILHEMGHVLGLGSTWSAQGLLTGRGSRQPRFIGTNASNAFSNLFRTTNLSIPVENSGSGGTRNVHFREDILLEELMTGFELADIDGDGIGDTTLAGSTTPRTSFDDQGNSVIDPGTFSNGTDKYLNPDTQVVGDYDGDGESDPLNEPLSLITVGALQDAGYIVNPRAADRWNPLTHQTDLVGSTRYGGTANERRISLGTRDRVGDLDFGYVSVSRPTIKNFTITPSPQAAGSNVTLSATGISDADQDDFLGVSFYRESNGVEGFQRGADTFIGLRTFAKNRVFAVEAPTTGLTGDQTFYAFATDEYGRVGKRQGVVNIQIATIPEGIPTGLAVRARSSNSARFAFTDTNTNASNYRVELATSRTFGDDTLVRVINLTADQMATNLNNLREGVTYYIRVRAYNLAGAGIYSRILSFEVA